MTARSFDLYSAERRAAQVVFILGLRVVRAAVLTKYRISDIHARITHGRTKP